MYMHTKALAGCGKTCRWMSAAASGDWVSASFNNKQMTDTFNIYKYTLLTPLP